MDVHGASSFHDNLLDSFNSALNRVLAGQVLSPIAMTFDIKITLALLDVAHAVRQGRPTQQLVVRACEEFASCALGIAPVDQSITVPRRRGVSRRDEVRRPAERFNRTLRSVVAEAE